jgi:Protein of unknown function (DUF2911)
MRTSTLFALTFCLLLFCALSAPNAVADEWNQATKLTFSEPVEIPGQALPAGTYWFTLMNDDSDRNIVQVWNADRTHLLATILAIPDYRLQPTGKTVIKFSERPTGTPEAIRAWFYPGDNYGHEFVYPEKRATELAKQTGKPVLSMPDEMASNLTKPAKAVTDSSVVALKKATVKAAKPSGEIVEIAEVIPPKRMPSASAKHMPKTASLLPLWGLLGFFFLGAGLIVGGIAKRMV